MKKMPTVGVGLEFFIIEKTIGHSNDDCISFKTPGKLGTITILFNGMNTTCLYEEYLNSC